MNCGPGSSDKPKDIQKNLKIVCKKIKAKSKKIFLLNQVHSNKFHFISEHSKLYNRYKGDALVTDKKNLPIAILTADCAPILIFDQKRKMIAAVHAGWKGAYKGIVPKVLKFMVQKGCSVHNITAAIGPCISLKSYEVKQDFIKRFLKKDIMAKGFFKKIKNKNYFSLSGYITYQLKSLGLKKIEVINKDTFDIKNNFFSARRSKKRNENDYGRNISVIMIN